jgi:uncharacterized protein (DUF1778 family)
MKQRQAIGGSKDSTEFRGRISIKSKKLIARAAKAQKKSLSLFMVEASEREAEHVLRHKGDK